MDFGKTIILWACMKMAMIELPQYDARTMNMKVIFDIIYGKWQYVINNNNFTRVFTSNLHKQHICRSLKVFRIKKVLKGPHSPAVAFPNRCSLLFRNSSCSTDDADEASPVAFGLVSSLLGAEADAEGTSFGEGPGSETELVLGPGVGSVLISVGWSGTPLGLLVVVLLQFTKS